MRFKTKREFLCRVETEWTALCALLDKIPDAEMLRRPSPAAASMKDNLMHLQEWHIMCQRWYADGQHGTPIMPAPGFTWQQCPALNKAIFEKHKDVSLPDARKKLRASHAKITKLIESLTEKELLQPGHFAWCGRGKPLPLTSYLNANTASHYRWAAGKAKRLLRSK